MKKQEFEKRISVLEIKVDELLDINNKKCGIETEPEYVITKEQI